MKNEKIIAKDVRRRILLATIILVGLFTGILMGFRDAISAMLVENIQIEMQDDVYQNKIYVENRIHAIFSHMEYVARDITWEDFSTTGQGSDNDENYGRTMNQRIYHMAELTSFSRVGVVNIYGEGVVGPDISIKDFPGIRESICGRPVALYVDETSFNSINSMVFSMPVRRNGNIVGVLYGILEPSAMRTIFNFGTLSGESESFLIDKDGRLLVQSRNGALTRQLGKYLVNWQKTEGIPELERLYLKVRQEKAGVELITLGDGSKFYLACMPISDVKGTYLIDIFPVEIVENRVTRVVNAVTLFFILLTTILVIGYYHSEKKNALYQNEIHDLAYLDDLTGLGNRSRYNKDLLDILQNPVYREFAVIDINIHNMKAINKFMGYEYGNEVLKTIARLLSDACQEGETCYRNVNDTFLIIMNSEGRDDITHRVGELINSISAYFAEQDGQNVKFSVGVYLVEEKNSIEDESGAANSVSSSTPSDIVSNARLAAKQKKVQNQNTIGFFDEAIISKMKNDRELENEFPKALRQGEFFAYFQPKYDIRNDETRLAGAEALVRWISPQKGFMSPGIFLPLFEKEGYMNTLDKHMLELVCQQQRAWLEAGYDIVPVSVNVARCNIALGERFREDIEEILKKYGIDKKYIQLEVLESDASVDENTLIRFVKNLSAHGFHIAMDDFGKGYSSLGLLNRMPLDCLKLDKILFDNWRTSGGNDDYSLVRCVIQMAHETGRVVVAEGIEEKFQVDLLKEFGCDYIQGYYFGKPLKADEFAERMNKRG